MANLYSLKKIAVADKKLNFGTLRGSSHGYLAYISDTYQIHMLNSGKSVRSLEGYHGQIRHLRDIFIKEILNP